MNGATATPLDPQLAAIAAGIRSRAEPSPFDIAPAQARERMRRAVLAARECTGVPQVGDVRDTIATDGALQVPVRIYQPAGDAQLRPTVLFFHGGGFVLGSIELMDDIARKLCRDLDAVLVSVEYRLAPEHPFPAAHDDALAATRWALRQVHELGGDPARVGLCGESAGANLATCCALAMRGEGAAIAAQLLVVPGVDLARDVARIRAAGHDHPMLGAGDLEAIARLYLGPHRDRAAQSPPSPLRAATLAGVAPAVIALAGHDPLREEGLAYADRLRAEGVPVQLLEFGDMFHPFFGFFAASQAACRASDAICRAYAAMLQVPAARLSTMTKETT